MYSVLIEPQEDGKQRHDFFEWAVHTRHLIRLLTAFSGPLFRVFQDLTFIWSHKIIPLNRNNFSSDNKECKIFVRQKSFVGKQVRSFYCSHTKHARLYVLTDKFHE